MNYKELAIFDTKLTADVVEWQPIEIDKSSSILACGTYFLDKENNKRLGCLYLLDFQNQEDINVLSTVEFTESGILDFKWLNAKQIITIDSVNKIELLEYNQNLKSIDRKSNLFLENDSIGLTIDFQTKSDGSNTILTSDTKGHLNLIKLENQNFNIEASFKAHDYEVWSVFMDRFDQNLIYSGVFCFALFMLND